MAPVRRRPSHGTPEPITFGHAGAAELLGTAVLHLASRPGFALKRRYLESKGLWQSDAPFGNATMTPEDAHAEAARGVASFNATFLELEGRPAQGARKKEERKEERKELGRSRRGKADSMEEEKLREALRQRVNKLREKHRGGLARGSGHIARSD